MKRYWLLFVVFGSIFVSLLIFTTNVGASTPLQTDIQITPTPVPPGVSVPGQANPSLIDEGVPDCRECHWDIYMLWERSSHGQGLSCGECHLAAQDDNHARSGHGAQGGPQECMSCHTTGYDPETDTWKEGNVHCTACHNPFPNEHPDVPAPINRSASLCGQCHTQANFEWQTSQHAVEGVTCIDCHSQHRANLRVNQEASLRNKSFGLQVIDSPDYSWDVDQCASCHQNQEKGYPYTVHANEDLTCASCHLAPLNNPLGSGQAKLSHTFTVDISVCMQCHVESLHEPVARDETGLETNCDETKQAIDVDMAGMDPMTSGRSVEVQASPASPDPFNFLIFTAVFGTFTGLGFSTGAISWVVSSIGSLKKKLKKGKTDEDHKAA